LIGADAGGVIGNGKKNVMIGAGAGGVNASDVNNSVFIGNQVGQWSGGSNELRISNYDDWTPLIFGKFDEDKLTINGTLHVEEVMKLKPVSAPSNPEKGSIYFDDTTNKLRVYDGSTWQDCW